ncbi:MAG: CoA pyrophosphatase [Thermoanaerobaculia bacterium]
MSEPHSWILQMRQRLESPPPERLGVGEARRAAVLVPLYVEGGQLWTILTKRAESLPHHRGQVAFPGGGLEAGEDSWAAALRETQEEIGIEGRRVLRLGELDEVASPSGFRIVPCVGAVPYPFELAPNPGEIDEVFATPLAELANPKLTEEREVRINGQRRNLRIYHVGRFLVWGVTARIVQNLLERIGIATLIDEPGV